MIPPPPSDHPPRFAARGDNARPSDFTVVIQCRDAIVELIAQRGFMSVDGLATRFGVTPQTIRRDVNSLYAAGRLSLMRVGTLADVAVLFTDRPPPPPVSEFKQAARVELCLAPD